MDVLLTLNEVFKIINCVTLSFRNTEMYSRNYVVSYYRKCFWINVLYKKGLFKSLHVQKCYMNMLMN